MPHNYFSKKETLSQLFIDLMLIKVINAREGRKEGKSVNDACMISQVV
jgi:hypothetical protein